MLLRKILSVFFGPRKKKPDFLRELENQRFQPPLDWTKDQQETHRWLTSIEHDQRKRLRMEPGAIILELEKEAPGRGETLMRVIVLKAQSPGQLPAEMGAILIDTDGEIAQGSDLVNLLMARRASDPLRPPGPRSLN
jgi:hypothetical protein